MMTIKMRKELTAEWQERDITQEKDYAILTNEMTKSVDLLDSFFFFKLLVSKVFALKPVLFLSF